MLLVAFFCDFTDLIPTRKGVKQGWSPTEQNAKLFFLLVTFFFCLLRQLNADVESANLLICCNVTWWLFIFCNCIYSYCHMETSDWMKCRVTQYQLTNQAKNKGFMQLDPCNFVIRGDFKKTENTPDWSSDKPLDKIWI